MSRQVRGELASLAARARNWIKIKSSRRARPCLGLVCSLALGLAGCAAPQQSADLKLVGEAYETIQRQYVNRTAVHTNDLTYGAISGMVDALGDTGHSTFLTPDMVRELKNMEQGEFKGIGIEVQMKDGHVVVVAPFDGSPAQHAGLKPGDIILKVGGQDISDWPLTRIIDKISGKVGTKVNLVLQDPVTERTREVSVARASIKMHEVTWHQLPGTSIAHVRLATFDAGVTRDLRKAIADIQQAGLTGIVLDLRNNPGGLLDEAIGVASQFMGDGAVLQAKDAKGDTESIPVEKGGLATNMPLAVLVNEGSASAAEIVAGALRDSRRGALVGQTTFGTGTVLEEFRLADGSALLLAVEEWLTPNGHSFWHKGIDPEFPVSMPAEATPLFPRAEKELTAEQLQASNDLQLLNALRLVTQESESSKLRALSAPNRSPAGTSVR